MHTKLKSSIIIFSLYIIYLIFRSFLDVMSKVGQRNQITRISFKNMTENELDKLCSVVELDFNITDTRSRNELVPKRSKRSTILREISPPICPNKERYEIKPWLIIAFTDESYVMIAEIWYHQLSELGYLVGVVSLSHIAMRLISDHLRLKISLI